MDIFKQLGITDADGNPMSENNINPLMGYQIVHNVTGRILPHTQRFEIMGSDYATKKIAQVQEFYEQSDCDIDTRDYHFEPVYLNELDDSLTGFLLLYTEEDEKTMGLFN
jgi:hypothetical protein